MVHGLGFSASRAQRRVHGLDAMEVLVQGDVPSTKLREEGGLRALETVVHARYPGRRRRRVVARVALAALRCRPSRLPGAACSLLECGAERGHAARRDFGFLVAH